MHCPNCHSQNLIKNGLNLLEKQIYRCKDCGRQFVLNPAKSIISDETKKLIDDMLLERIPLAGIARGLKISERWLQNYVNNKYDQVQHEVQVIKKGKGRLTIECDELWSYVGNKQNKQWIWLAMDRDTREIIGACIGDRSAESAKALWNSLPAVYRQCAVSYTDFWDAYSIIFPSMRHRAVGKETGNTLNVLIVRYVSVFHG